jgi:hypothetical protein
MSASVGRRVYAVNGRCLARVLGDNNGFSVKRFETLLSGLVRGAAPLWFAKMISLAKSLRISDIQIDIHRGDLMNARHVALLHSHRREFSLGTVQLRVLES